jgi:hypothetical protein
MNNFFQFNHKMFTIMRLPFSLLYLLAITGLLLTTACDDDDDNQPVNEPEVITTVRLNFENQATGNIQPFVARDPDGDGGQPPVIDDITLDNNATYIVRAEFLDESDPNDPEDITEEVEEEDEEHLICYVFGGTVFDNSIQQDEDGNGDPLGLETTMSTLNAGNGTLQITLKHEPDKSIADACSTGETDVEVTFDVTVQ